MMDDDRVRLKSAVRRYTKSLFVEQIENLRGQGRSLCYLISL